MNSTLWSVLILCASLSVACSAQAQRGAGCVANAPQVQVLGSGGPFGNGRAASGYLLWLDGASRVMVDAGGGTFARFHESGARLDQVALLALSHFHPDHATEVPALLWPLTGRLTVAGPSGSAGYASLEAFLDGMFGSDGVFRVLNERFEFTPLTVEVTAAPRQIFAGDGFAVWAMGVPHGDVPTVAFRIDLPASRVAFSSDQTGADPAFVDFVRGVDLLVVHFAGNEDGSGRPDLHAAPSTWGRIAREAGVGHLLLSHLSVNQDLDANLGHLRAAFSGTTTLAEDLMCISLPR